ncbi:MAG: hypothetical protein WCG83_00150 [Candidatus Peregrinibacteria bacterium]
MMISDRTAGYRFQGKDEEEHFQFYFHQHWIRMLWPTFRLILWNVLIVAAGFAILGTGSLNEPYIRQTILLILTAFFLLSHFEYLDRWFHYLLYVIVVTDKKLHRIKKTLITTDDHESTDLWVIQDIHKRQHGIIQNLLGYGSLILEAQETEVRVHFTPLISQRYEQLMHLRELARTRIASIEEFFRQGKTP